MTKNPPRPDINEAQSKVLRCIPPNDMGAESAVLGGILKNANVLAMALDSLTEGDFYSPAHGLIFEAARELFEKRKPVDIKTVASLLGQKNRLHEVGGTIYLSDLVDEVVSALGASLHIQTVKDRALERELAMVGARIIDDIYDSGRTTAEKLDEAGAAILAVGMKRNRSNAVQVGSDTLRVMQGIKEIMVSGKTQGETTGYHMLDMLLGGLKPTDQIIVAARPGMGKTSFALNLALCGASNGVPSAFFSLEMARDQLIKRALCVLGKVNTHNVMNGAPTPDEYASLERAADVLCDLPLFIDDTPGLTPGTISAACRSLKREKGIKVAYIDYVGMMRPGVKKDSREQEVAHISASLKNMAKELEICVVLLSQLNRDVEKRGNKRPVMADLRESGSLEQDADAIIFLYNEHAAANKGKHAMDSPTEIILSKHRNGPTGTVNLWFQREFTGFEDMDMRAYGDA